MAVFMIPVGWEFLLLGAGVATVIVYGFKMARGIISKKRYVLKSDISLCKLLAISVEIE